MTAPTKPGLIDVTRLPLRDLWTLDEDVLSQALRRVTEAADDAEGRPQHAVSAFNSAV